MWGRKLSHHYEYKQTHPHTHTIKATSGLVINTYNALFIGINKMTLGLFFSVLKKTHKHTREGPRRLARWLVYLPKLLNSVYSKALNVYVATWKLNQLTDDSVMYISTLYDHFFPLQGTLGYCHKPKSFCLYTHRKRLVIHQVKAQLWKK